MKFLCKRTEIRTLIAVLVLPLVSAPAAQCQTFTVLYSFRGRLDGSAPSTPLLIMNGIIYGTTPGGGSGHGVVFMMNALGMEKVLHTFSGTDGAGPYAGLIRDQAGNLYGTTAGGGAFGEGTVFKLDSTRQETVLHDFTGGTDGAAPYAGLTIDSAGVLYGTASEGGMSGCEPIGCGTV